MAGATNNLKNQVDFIIGGRNYTTTNNTEVKMENKQTAVEWLENKLDIILPLDFEWDKLNNIFQQAKEMEKEQIIDAFTNEDNIQWDKQLRTRAAEQYYNETYGGNK